MTREEYDRFVAKFNAWAESENAKVAETARKMGIRTPVVKEEIFKLQDSEQIIRRANYTLEQLQSVYQMYYAMGTEQMMTMDLTREMRKEGVMDFIRLLDDEELIRRFNKMDNYQIQALISKGIIPSFIPYIDTDRYDTADAEEMLIDNGYDIDTIYEATEGV